MLVEDIDVEDFTCEVVMSMTRIMAFITFYEGLGKDPNSVYNRAKHFLQLVKFTNILPEGQRIPLRSLQQWIHLFSNNKGYFVITPK